MPRTIDSNTLRAMTRDDYRPVVLVEVVTPSLNIRLTSNTQDVTFDGDLYTAGLLSGISEIPETTDLNDAQIAVSFSGIDAAIKAAVVSPDFINSKVTVRIQFFNQDWVASGDGLLYFIGSAASQNIASGQTSAITVSCKSRIASLSRPRSERYSDQEQQAQYPGDLGMQYASELASKTIIWPSSEWFKEDAK